MSRRHYSSSAADTTLSSSITSGATSITVGSITGLPVQFPYTLILDPETPTEEVIEITAGAGTTLTAVRGVDSTTALAHTAGAVVRHGVSARDYDEPNAHVNASTGVHGVAGSVVGTTDTQILTGKTIDLTDNTVVGTLAEFSAAVSDADVVGVDTVQTMTNKTLTAPTLNDPTITGNISGLALRKVISSGSASLSAVDGNGNRSITVGAIEDGADVTAYFIDGFTNRVNLVPTFWNTLSVFFDPDNQSSAGQLAGTGTTVFYKIVGDA